MVLFSALLLNNTLPQQHEMRVHSLKIKSCQHVQSDICRNLASVSVCVCLSGSVRYSGTSRLLECPLSHDNNTTYTRVTVT